MSTKELIEEGDKLLECSWEEHEKKLVKRLLDTIISYKSFIPNSLKLDIKELLIMANRIKYDYDELVIKLEKLIQDKSDLHNIYIEQSCIEKQTIELEKKIIHDLEELDKVQS